MKLTKHRKVTPSIEIDFNNVRICIYRLNALIHPIRRRIIDVIGNIDSIATAKQIAKEITLDEKIIAKHLAILVKAKMITSKKASYQKLVYKVNYKNLRKASKFITEINKKP